MRCDTVGLCGADGEIKAQLDEPLGVLVHGTSVAPQSAYTVNHTPLFPHEMHYSVRTACRSSTAFCATGGPFKVNTIHGNISVGLDTKVFLCCRELAVQCQRH
jgi:hypothetical protein